jgi:Predicted ATP-binding protein involved in virulence
MKLEKIKIQNYRCFKNYEIAFTQGVNILIGKNGSGKTTIINAIRHALSFIFDKKTSSGNNQALATSANGLTIETPKALDALYDESIPDFCYPISIKSKATIKGKPFPEWEISKNSARGTVSSSKYKEAYQAFENKNYLPVLSIYSDSYPHIKSPITNNKYVTQILNSDYIPKNLGYFQWGEESACTDIWEQHFINLWKKITNKRTAYHNYASYSRNEKDADDFLEKTGFIKDLDTRECFAEEFSLLSAEAKLRLELIKLENDLEIINNYLVKFSLPINKDSDLSKYEIKGIEVVSRIKQDYLSIRFVDGRTELFQNLPAGYKRLFSIVLDIAYRGYLLQLNTNKDLPFSRMKAEISGVVVIDEIDLHLHPALEQEVVQRFQNTFPDIQFIMSTHSNLVIANLEENDKKNSIIRLEYDEGKYKNTVLPNLFGIGYESSLSDYMGAPPRNSTVKYLAEAYLRLEKRGENKQADKTKSELSVLVGEKNVDGIIKSFR